jgi:hypothetical protein
MRDHVSYDGYEVKSCERSPQPRPRRSEVYSLSYVEVVSRSEQCAQHGQLSCGELMLRCVVSCTAFEPALVTNESLITRVGLRISKIFDIRDILVKSSANVYYPKYLSYTRIAF